MKTCNVCQVPKPLSKFYRYKKGKERRKPACIICTNLVKNRYDWKKTKTGWPYKGDIGDSKYMKERSEFFNKSGNGWWWYSSSKPAQLAIINRKRRIKKENEKRKETSV